MEEKKDDLIIELTDFVEDEIRTAPSEKENLFLHDRETKDLVLEEIKRQMPAMVEEFVRPLMNEAVKEMIESARKMLPEIVEKVVREEIEKLKKIRE